MSNLTARTPNPWLVLALICLPVFVGSLDLTIVSAFLPDVLLKLGLPLQSTLDDAAWVVTGYLLAYAISMLFMGRISDLVGRRWVYITCLIIFMGGSLLVATAHLLPTNILYIIFRRLGQRPEREMVTLLAIIIGRIVQAFGAGALVPVSLALVSDLFPPERRAQPLGIIGAVDTLGWVLGHLYGGVLVNLFETHSAGFTNLIAHLGLDWPPPDWRTLFWLNVPLSLLALVFTLSALRNIRSERAEGRFDLLGTLLIGGALVALVLGLGANTEISAATNNFEQIAPLPPYALPALLLALVCFGAFIWVESHTAHPLLDLQMFRNRNLASGALINLFVGYCLMIGLVCVPILVNVRAESTANLAQAALQAGVLLSALTVPMALAAIPGGWLTDRYGHRAVTLGGLAVALIGFALVWQTWTLSTPDGVVALEMALVGIGLGLTFSPISAAVINAADDARRGVASALVIVLRLIGMTLATSSLTTLALQRINYLTSAANLALITDPDQFIALYSGITIQVLAEIALIGALLCALALIPAWRGLDSQN